MTAAPPPLPPESTDPSMAGVPPKKTGLSTLVIVLIVVGVLGVFVVAGLIGTITVVVPQMRERQMRLTCQQNLSQLGMLYFMRKLERPKDGPAYSGSALLLAWRKSKNALRAGQEEILLCPGDNQVRPLLTEADRRRYDTIDLANPPRDACSYAVRDFGRFPIPENPTQPEILAACTHHAMGAMVVYDDGQARFYEWAELGITGPADADVGPNAKSPLLRQVCRTPGVTEK